ncbi:MAG: AMP-binding protein, partial [Thermoleophilaceae bacterium]
MTLAQMLEQAGLRRPAADAVVDGRRRLTYADLVDQATRLGRAFARLGVGKGDRVLIVLRNRLEHVLAYWALQTIGGVPTPAGFRLAAREVRYILDDCEASVVLFEAATAAAVLEAVADHHAR